MIIVIGSGPAAIAATWALVQQGHQVTILNIGNRLETERQETVDRMSRQEPKDWKTEDLEKIIGKRATLRETNHSKMSYGSTFSVDHTSSAANMRWGNHEGFNHSLARGGLSNVWGASLLPYRQQDIEDWPIRLEDLEPHYRAVMDFVPSTAVEDDLQKILPSYSTPKNPLEPSRQGAALLADLEIRKLSLRKSGISFGRSRLAIHATNRAAYHDCAYCALCLSGCPYGLIYSSAQTLSHLIESGKVHYLAGHQVEKFEDSGQSVIVTGRDLSKDVSFSLTARRIFVGAGVLPTAQIVLNSLQAFNTPVRLLDSQYFIYPLLRMRLIDRVEFEKMHTSSQVFLEIDDKRVSSHLVHLQIYGYSSFLHDELQRIFLRWPLRFAFFRRHFLGRLLVAQGFIHSKESSSIELSLEKQPDEKPCLNTRFGKSNQAFVTTLKVGWKLLKQTLNLRALPILPGLRYFNPGSGYHSGGTFPMRHQPQALETDTLGRLSVAPRVHLIDASVLPSIPATSITFSVMANAHRIATHAGTLDPP